MRVYEVHTSRNAIRYNTLAEALRVIAFHHRFGQALSPRPIHLRSYVV